MSALCIAAAGLAFSLPLQTFTLAWTHSIEKIRWEEDYRVVQQDGNARLQLTEARIRGNGAGMEIPDGAVLRNGVWHYVPALAPLPELRLSRSNYAGDYQLCWEGACHALGDIVGPPDAAPLVVLRACRRCGRQRTGPSADQQDRLHCGAGTRTVEEDGRQD